MSKILQYWLIKGNDFIQDVAKSKKVHDGETSLRKRTQAGNRGSPEEGYEQASHCEKKYRGPSLPDLSFCFSAFEMV